MADPKFPRSERTIFPREHRRPLLGEHFDQAKEAEKVRAKHDPNYITADEARELPQEVAELPEVRSRIEYSRHDWPENRASATRALGPLPTGCGERIEKRTIQTGDLFEGAPIED